MGAILSVIRVILDILGRILIILITNSNNTNKLTEALESVMCDVIKIRLKRRIATRSRKGNQLLNSYRSANFKDRIPKF